MWGADVDDGRVGSSLPLAFERPPPNVAQPPPDRLLRLDVDHEQRLLEPRSARKHLALVVEHDRVPVEHELVLRADGVDERDVANVVARTRLEHLLALPLLADVERRRRDVHDQLRTCQREVGRGRPRLPDVLADRRPDERVAVLEQDEITAGREVAVLVEHAVVRKEPLAVERLHLAGRAHGARVVEVALEVRSAHEGDDAAHLAGDRAQRLLGRADEARP